MKQENNFKHLMIVTIIWSTIAIIMCAELINFIYFFFIHKFEIRPIAIILQIPAFIVAVLLVLTIVFMGLNKKISYLNNAIHKIAQGDFSVRLDLKKSGALKKTYSDVNTMAKELDKTATLREDFINEFSHEFKTPITSIKGFAELLQNKTLSPEEEDRALSIIAKEAGRLANLSNNTILMTKLESTQVLANMTNFSLTEQIRHVIIMLLPRFNSKKIKIHVNMEETMYDGDEELLEQVWINILNNAYKFINKNGNIWIKLRKDNDFISVNFKNDGPLISKNDLNKIQEKFYQINNQEKEGLGLGLSIVKRIINLHHGSLLITSSKKKLTNFEIKLPTKK